MNETWTALAAAFGASALTILGTWLLNWRRDVREDRNGHRAEVGAAVHEVASLSYDVALRAQHAKVFSAHYSSPLTVLGVMFGAERAPDLASLLEPMLVTLQQLGAANARLWMCGDQELVNAGNAVQLRTAEVIDAFMVLSGDVKGEVPDDEALNQLAEARRALVSTARDRLGVHIVDLSTN
jgi:hypothetical protein